MKTAYTEKDRQLALAVLASYGGNLALACRATGVPRTTLRSWQNAGPVGDDGDNAPSSSGKASRPTLGEATMEAAERLLGLACGQLEDMSVAQRVLAYCQLVDKALVLGVNPSGDSEPTTGQIDESLAERLSRLTPAQRDRFSDLNREIHQLLASADSPPDAANQDNFSPVNDRPEDP